MAVDTKVVNVKVQYLRPEYKNLVEWLSDDTHVYIGRDMSFYVAGAYKSKWHNPFKVSSKGYSLDDSLRLYEEHIRTSGLINDIEELRGLVLGCWCKPDRCHGDVLVKLLAEKQM